MIEKALTQRVVVRDALAVACGIMILIGIVYLTREYPVPAVRADAHPVAASSGSAELPAPDLRLWRVHLVLG